MEKTTDNEVCLLIAEEVYIKTERFKVEISLPILDTVNFELTKRAEAYSQIGNLLSFFTELKTITSDPLKKKLEHLVNKYHKNLNFDNLLNEYEHLKH